MTIVWHRSATINSVEFGNIEYFSSNALFCHRDPNILQRKEHFIKKQFKIKSAPEYKSNEGRFMEIRLYMQWKT